MEGLSGLRSFFWMLFVLALVLAILAGLIAAGWTKIITPPPENVADGMVDAFQAHRYSGAMEGLSQDLSQQVNTEDLQSLVEALEKSPLKGIEDAQGEGSTEQEETATAEVKVKFGNLEEKTVQFPMKKENGEWKVNSIQPLQGLAGP